MDILFASNWSHLQSDCFYACDDFVSCWDAQTETYPGEMISFCRCFLTQTGFVHCVHTETRHLERIVAPNTNAATQQSQSVSISRAETLMSWSQAARLLSEVCPDQLISRTCEVPSFILRLWLLFVPHHKIKWELEISSHLSIRAYCERNNLKNMTCRYLLPFCFGAASRSKDSFQNFSCHIKVQDGCHHFCKCCQLDNLKNNKWANFHFYVAVTKHEKESSWKLNCVDGWMDR